MDLFTCEIVFLFFYLWISLENDYFTGTSPINFLNLFKFLKRDPSNVTILMMGIDLEIFHMPVCKISNDKLRNL